MSINAKKQKIELTKDDMWKLTNNQVDIGIEGYVVPSLCKIPKKVKEQFKKVDEDGKVILPKRPNFLDDVYKWANSYYDKEKAEKVIEDLAAKDRTLEYKPKPKEQIVKSITKRVFFADQIIREEKRNHEYLEDKLEIIEEIKEKTKEWQQKQLPFLESMKQKYCRLENGINKGSLPNATRVTVVADAEHVGEKYPFYNTYKNPDDPEEEDPKKKKLFYPDKNPTWKSAPKWNFQKHLKKEEEIEKEVSRKEQEKERQDSLFDAIKEKQGLKDYNLKVREAFATVKNRGNIHFSYTVRQKKEEEQTAWESYLEQNPKKVVGPQHYWKYPKVGYKVKKDYKPPEEDDNGKTYFQKREVTDKRIYKPMKKHIF